MGTLTVPYDVTFPPVITGDTLTVPYDVTVAPVVTATGSITVPYGVTEAQSLRTLTVPYVTTSRLTIPYDVTVPAGPQATGALYQWLGGNLWPLNGDAPTSTGSAGSLRVPYDVAAPTQAFVHPGVMYTTAQLNQVKTELAAGNSFRTTEYNKMIAQKAGGSGTAGGTNAGQQYSSLSWVPHPSASVSRGSFNSGNNIDDDDMQDDLRSALCHALIWVYKGTRANANKSIEIMNAWAQTINIIQFDTTQYQDGRLLAGWTGTVFARAAELIRYTFTPQAGETPLDITNIKRVFTDVWWPRVGVGHSGVGFNTYTSLADSAMQIAVFLDDKVKYNYAAQYLRNIMPGLVYLTGDDNPWPWGGPQTLTYSTPAGAVLNAPNGLPIPTKSVAPPDANVYDRSNSSAVGFMTSWTSPTSLPNGLWGEMGRDMHHTAFGLGGVNNTCETAWIQGLDLYSEIQTRYVTTIESCTKFFYDWGVNHLDPPPGWPFALTVAQAKSPSYGTSSQRVWGGIAHNHYVGRKGLSMPRLTAHVNGYAMSSPYTADLHMCYEFLTTYGTAP